MTISFRLLYAFLFIGCSYLSSQNLNYGQVKNEKLLLFDSEVICEVYYDGKRVSTQEDDTIYLDVIDSIGVPDRKGYVHYGIKVRKEDSLIIPNQNLKFKTQRKKNEPYLCWYNSTSDIEFYFSQKGSYRLFVQVIDGQGGRSWLLVDERKGKGFSASDIDLTKLDVRIEFLMFKVEFKNKNGSFTELIPVG